MYNFYFGFFFLPPLPPLHTRTRTYTQILVQEVAQQRMRIKAGPSYASPTKGGGGGGSSRGSGGGGGGARAGGGAAAAAATTMMGEQARKTPNYNTIN